MIPSSDTDVDPADVIANPVTGERIRFREATPAALRFDYRLEPGGFGVGKVDHVHPKQAERIAVESGRLGVRIDGDEWTATPGTRFSVLPGTDHTIWNEGADELHAVIELRPALEMRPFFETLFGLAREGKTNDWGLPGPLQLAVLADEYREAFAFGRIPLPVQRALVGALAPIGRRAGYRAQYDRFSGERARTGSHSGR
ncbi:cupin domain-containing protein [Halopiger aswanensis]|uniref:Cupin domain-containing protein n=1 Tax=Halopiger aswanensis TaxID=148449 RepID=A0A3R7FUC0_9EURY|nr:cupin domain-containing protein [Halopiger aswanensis]RKD93585.1 Cupin domain-containing protein [Halopiger aswanensis]